VPNTDQQRLSLPAAVYLGIVGSSVLLILPVFVGTVLQIQSIGTERAGWLGSGDLIGYALGSLVAFRLIARVSWRTLATSGLVLMIVGNLISILASDFFLSLFVVRVGLTGLGAGLVIAVPYNALGSMPDSERSTGLYWTFNVLGGSAALLIFPLIAQQFGPGALFGALAILAASAIPVALTASSSGDAKETGTDDRSGTLFTGLGATEIIMLCSIALFNLGLGGVWAFIDRPALSLGLSGQTIGWILSGTYLVCMLGSGTATLQGRRLGLIAPYVGAMLLVATATILLSQASTILIYIAVVATINFCWNYSMTYQFLAVFETSTSKHTATLIFFAQSMGLMFGPALSGMISQRASVHTSFLVAAALCLASAALYRLGFSKN